MILSQLEYLQASGLFCLEAKLQLVQNGGLEENCGRNCKSIHSFYWRNGVARLTSYVRTRTKESLHEASNVKSVVRAWSGAVTKTMVVAMLQTNTNILGEGSAKLAVLPGRTSIDANICRYSHHFTKLCNLKGRERKPA